MVHKALKESKRTLRKGFNRLESELKECQDLLDKSNKEVLVLRQKLETKQRSEELNSKEPAEIVEELVTTAGDWKTCDMCNTKFKGMVKLIKHQQSSHFTCTMCPKNVSWIALSLEHLKIHQKHSHGIKHSKAGQKCNPCKKVFPDAMSLNVHNLKEHPTDFKCKQCGVKCNDKSLLDNHVETNHIKKTNIKQMKCIYCEHTVESEAELTKHYEEKHITKKHNKTKYSQQDAQTKCRNGPNCRYLKDNRCNYQHDEPKRNQQRREPSSKHQSGEEKRREQPWQAVQPRRHHKESRQGTQLPGRIGGAQNLNACRNGPSCKFLRDNRCSFYHSQAREQGRQPLKEARWPRSGGQQRYAPLGNLRQCKWGDRCDKGRNCDYLHLASDFFPLHSGRKN